MSGGVWGSVRFRYLPDSADFHSRRMEIKSGHGTNGPENLP